ncbi:helix-turn-helix transcriptional regulator [Paucibacter sp. O1-1]|nr:helix-turn-helix domain-containing protein [Paucibacter sp. O1-1]MDA3829875.1 helix-turn-helix transcriptional regulator [Paucibacter sp. O1-1]
MSPFSKLLYEFRCCYDIRQVELAARLGYEQSYISAIETGLKEPTPEFVRRLEDALPLDPAEKEALRGAVQASNRRLVLDADAPSDHFLLLNDLRKELKQASPRQIRMIRDILNLQDGSRSECEYPPTRIRRRRSHSEVPM